MKKIYANACAFALLAIFATGDVVEASGTTEILLAPRSFGSAVQIGNETAEARDSRRSALASSLWGDVAREAYSPSSRANEARPARYDLRNTERGSHLTPVKNQGSRKTGWAFAALGSLESSHRKQTGESLDLSEMHLAYYSYMDAPAFNSLFPRDVLQNGGSASMAVAMLARGVGPVLEEDAPYDVLPGGSASRYKKVLRLREAYPLNPEVASAGAADPSDGARKRLIMEQGAIAITFNADSFNEAYNEDYFAWCNTESAPSGRDHSVLIVGWDDGFIRENFNAGRRPKREGAWLVKNSYGSDWGDEGFFWLSYEDSSMAGGTVYKGSAVRENEVLYGHDDLGWCRSSGWGTSGNAIHMANLFQAGGEEDLTSVSFYTTAADARYEISIYTGPFEAASPTSGALMYRGSGRETFAGYHTHDLDAAVALLPEQDFSVVIKMETPNFKYPAAVECEQEGYSENFVPREGVSFFSRDGEFWVDGVDLVSEGEKVPQRACIKAATIAMSLGSPGEAQAGSGGCDAGLSFLPVLVALLILRKKDE